MKILGLILFLALAFKVNGKDLLTVKVSGSMLPLVEGLTVDSFVEIENVGTVTQLLYFLKGVDGNQDYKPLSNLSALYLDLDFDDGTSVTILGNDLLVINGKFYISQNAKSILRCLFTHLISVNKLRWSVGARYREFVTEVQKLEIMNRIVHPDEQPKPGTAHFSNKK
jgi:hypothetical protein